IRAGRTFVTNGPLLEFTLGGKQAGDTLRLPAAAAAVRLTASLWSFVPVDHFQVIGNGKVVADLPLTDRRTAASSTRAIPSTASGLPEPDHALPAVYGFAAASVSRGRMRSMNAAAAAPTFSYCPLK